MEWLRKNPSNDFYKELSQELESDLLTCVQCQKCTAVCPVARWAETTPSQLVKIVVTGEQERSMRADINWLCNSCDSCLSVCPVNISIRELASTLKRVSFIHGYADESVAPVEMIPLLYEAVHNNLGKRGRLWFTSLAATYKLKTFNFFEDTPTAVRSLLKGLLPLTPPKKCRNQVKMISKLREMQLDEIEKQFEEEERKARNAQQEEPASPEQPSPPEQPESLPQEQPSPPEQPESLPREEGEK